MAIIRVVSRKLYNQIRDVLDGGDVVLMPEDLAEVKGYYKDNQEVEYNFGGQADVMVDLVEDGDHYFFTHLEAVEDDAD